MSESARSAIQSASASAIVNSASDLELETKVRKCCERISENLHICANEPSLAFYRLAEHVRKALPPTISSQKQVVKLQHQLHGAYLDADYGLETVKGMARASECLNNVQDLLKNAIFLQQQIRYEQSRSRPRKEAPTMYQRLSAHLTSVDLPDLSDLRETASRVAESVQKGSSSRTASLDSALTSENSQPGGGSSGGGKNPVAS